MRRLSSVVYVFILTARVHAAESEPKPIAGVGPAGEIIRVHTGFKFTEDEFEVRLRLAVRAHPNHYVRITPLVG